MGMPACRIGDLTEHGGTVMVGFPTVLIGEMPASRIGDMHVCPMVTPGVPPIPHVGGPFVLGSPTVIVGMMPQSRVTDMLVCVGPPDQAVLGCMTVLVGMAGGAGAAGAAAGAAAMGVAVPQPAPGAVSSSDPASNAPAQTKAALQPDGSVYTSSSVPGKPLPPITLKQPGWPDLPPENTATFSGVQPATVLPGTKLYAPADADDGGANSYWTTEPPDAEPGPDGSTNGPTAGASPSDKGKPSLEDALLTSATHMAVLMVTSPGGMKAWAGAAASEARGLLVYAPPEVAQAVSAVQKFKMPPVPPRPSVPRIGGF